MEDLGFSFIEKEDNISLKFPLQPVYWERRVSKLIEDRVILDVEEAKEFMIKFNDPVIYEVYKLGEFLERFEKVTEKTGIACDITLLKHGIFSISRNGELFCTYGHKHKTEMGEVYHVLKNDCFLELSDIENFDTIIVKLKEGDTFFIHPKFLHRLICSPRKDCLVIGFVPLEAGHDYDVVKNKGFPYHVFFDYSDGELKFSHNPKFGEVPLKLIGEVRRKENVFQLFFSGKLKSILEKPNSHEEFYTLD